MEGYDPEAIRKEFDDTGETTWKEKMRAVRRKTNQEKRYRTCATDDEIHDSAAVRVDGIITLMKSNGRKTREYILMELMDSGAYRKK